MNNKEYQEAVRKLDQLIDLVGENEYHPLMDEVTKLGELIEKYEDKNTPELLEK